MVCLPKCLYNFAFPPAVNKHFSCSTFWPVFGIVSVLDFYNRYVASCCFKLHSHMMGNLFHVFICHQIWVYSLVRCLWRSLVNFQPGCLYSYCWILRVFCIFCKIIMYHMCFVNIFSQVITCLFILLTVSLEEK